MPTATRQKKTCRPNIVADDEFELYNGSDHRQTIASPLSAERKVLELYQQQSQFDQSHSLAQTKPPLKPSSHRKYYTKSVCTKSTSSTTYVSSDSEEEDGSACNDDSSYIVSQKSSCSCSESASIGARKPDKARSSRAVALIPNCDSPTSTPSESNPGRHVTSLVPIVANFPDRLLYDDDDYSVYNLTSDDSCGVTLDDDDDSVSDFDKLIQESSSRWKSSTEAVVSRTSTAAFLQGSTTLPSAISKNLSANDVSGHGRPSSRLTAKDKEKLIEKQQAEISRLRGMLLARVGRDTHHSSPLNSYVAMVPNDSKIVPVKGEVRPRDVAPFEHIEVRLMHGVDDEAGFCCNWQDDLTLGSSFNNALDRENIADSSSSSRNLVSNQCNVAKSRSINRRCRPSASK
jgi:hypothetical protein